MRIMKIKKGIAVEAVKRKLCKKMEQKNSHTRDVAVVPEAKN